MLSAAFQFEGELDNCSLKKSLRFQLNMDISNQIDAAGFLWREADLTDFKGRKVGEGGRIGHKSSSTSSPASRTRNMATNESSQGRLTSFSGWSAQFGSF